MTKSSYYEYHTYPADLKVICFPLNVIMNRAHWHTALEILLCVKGSVSVAMGGCEYRLHEGDLITIDSGIGHEIFDGQPGGQQLIFEIEDQWIKREPNHIIDFRTVGDGAADSCGDEVRKVIAGLYDLACTFHNLDPNSSAVSGLDREIPPRTWYHAVSAAYYILEMIYPYRKRQEREDKKRPSALLTELIQIVQTDFAAIRSQEEVAERLGVSISSLHRVLKSQMGVSFIQYLTSVRVSAAEALLLDGSSEILDIAEQCGFSGASTFYRDFKKYTGSTPSQYRKRRISKNAYLANPSVLARNVFELVDISEMEIGRIFDRSPAD